MENQEQSVNVAIPDNNRSYEELTNACELLGRYLMLNETLSAFMGPLNSKITLSTGIADLPNLDGKYTKQKVLKVVCTRYTEDDTPETTVINCRLEKPKKKSKKI